ncbi:hypothetical protein [Nostoc sp. 106C]|uniref:hypothetical protein n=1 Tax=Nostoc sp. 106C TaxID=1932667 RepID=UPI001412BF7F|nr:hypothetical protein [Nostoc sp. 106C]
MKPVLGTLQDREKLIEAARSSDGVIHTAFIHDYSDFAGVVKTECDVISAFVEALAGSGKPFIATSGTGLLGDTGDRIIDDSDSFEFQGELACRAAAEQDIVRAAQQNIRSCRFVHFGGLVCFFCDNSGSIIAHSLSVKLLEYGIYFLFYPFFQDPKWVL